MSASSLLNGSTQVIAFTVAATGAVTITAINGQAPSAGLNGFFSLKYAEGYYAELVMASSAGTVDAVLQHSTDMTVTNTPAGPVVNATWRTLPLKFGQLAAGAGTNALAFKPAIGLSDAAFAVTPALTGAAVATNIPFNFKAMRLYTTLGTAGAATGQLIFTATPKGNVVQ